MYLLDTMVVSALRRPDRHAAVVRWLEAQPAEALYISVIIVAEIMYGAVRQSRRQPAFAEQLEQWLEAVVTSFHDRVLPLDEEAAKRWGLLHAELGYTNSDLQIAATALRHNLTVVTRNVRDFIPTGVRVINPFEGDEE